MVTASVKTVVLVFLITTVLVLLLFGFILLIVFLYRKRQQRFARQIESLRINAEKELLETQLEIQEHTFQYISQEIHDNIGQFISLAKLQLNTMDFDDPLLVRVKAEHSAELLTRALDDLRDLSRSLSSDMVRRHGLVPAIQLQVSQLKKLGIADVSFEVTGEVEFIEDQKEIFVLRIVQEAISNIVRHAEARMVSVVLQYGQRVLKLSVIDDGKGFDQMAAAQKSSSGIINMTRRANMIGGQFSIESKAGDGTSVRLCIPF